VVPELGKVTPRDHRLRGNLEIGFAGDGNGSIGGSVLTYAYGP
jgi:hypothetical protein